jgi:hypothetical protein
MRYCSRCGFPLETVTLLLNSDGILPSEQIAKKRSHRSRVATESLILTLFSWAVAMACTLWFDASGIYEGIAKIGGFTFFMLGFVGLFRFLYAFLFLKMDTAEKNRTAPRYIPEARPGQLPPPQAIPISDFQRQPNTREMAPQASVTENTTRFLEED